MGYIPLDLQDGHVLTADDIKHIEDGILAANQKDTETWTFTLDDGSSVTKKVVVAK